MKHVRAYGAQALTSRATLLGLLWEGRGLLCIALVFFAATPALASDCNWLEMGISGLGMRSDESSCVRLLDWDAYVQQNEQAVLKQQPLISEPRYELLIAGIVSEMQQAIEARYGPQQHYNVHIVNDGSINAF